MLWFRTHLPLLIRQVLALGLPARLRFVRFNN